MNYNITTTTMFDADYMGRWCKTPNHFGNSEWVNIKRKGACYVVTTGCGDKNHHMHVECLDYASLLNLLKLHEFGAISHYSRAGQWLFDLSGPWKRSVRL